MSELTKRQFLVTATAVVAAALVPNVALGRSQASGATLSKDLTLEDLRAASKVAGVELTDDQLASILKDVQETLTSLPELRKQTDDSFLAPAQTFHVMGEPPETRLKFKGQKTKVKKPETEEDLAFLSATELSHLIHTHQVTSVELTQLYLSRLKKYGPKLRCVITLTEELAMKQAIQADKELKAGKSRGPLHGLPYGVKDLFAVPGYPTTWGAAPYRDQVFKIESAIYTKLREAGAVLVAKLSMGALAEGDKWFMGRTESPWDPKIGASGSSAGSGSATAAGLVAFAIGTETSGSVVSPSHNCRVTGLRPTFGSVSRYGAMALSWSMDKVGPLCRTAEDCAMVFSVLLGRDERDPSTIERGFDYGSRVDVKKLRFGVLVGERNAKKPLKIEGVAGFEALAKLGANLAPMAMPKGPDALGIILVAEAAAAFDALTRSPKLDDLKDSFWPGTFRSTRLVPAVDLVLADRGRRALQLKYEDVFESWDIIAVANQGFERVYQWNLTGHPQVLVPMGADPTGRTISLSLVGPLFSEATLLSVASQVQRLTGQPKKRPDMGQWA